MDRVNRELKHLLNEPNVRFKWIHLAHDREEL